jgi:hypothetical protein
MRLNSPSSSLLQASTELCTCVKISGSQAGGVPQLLAPFGDFGMPDDIYGVIIAAFTGKNCSQSVSRFSSPVAAQEAAGVLLRAGESLIPPWCANCKKTRRSC